MAHLNYDYIQLRNIQLPLPIRINPDAWHREDKAQPAIISLRASYPTSLISKSSNGDDVNSTLNYGTLYRAIESKLNSRNRKGNGSEGQAPAAMDIVQAAKIIAGTTQKLVYDTLMSLDDGISFSYQHDEWFVNHREEVAVIVQLPKAILRAAGGLNCKVLVRDRRGEEDDTDVEFKIQGIKCFCVIGVNPHERLEKQAVELMLYFRFKQRDPACERFLRCNQDLTKQIAEVSFVCSLLFFLSSLHDLLRFEEGFCFRLSSCVWV